MLVASLVSRGDATSGQRDVVAKDAVPRRVPPKLTIRTASPEVKKPRKRAKTLMTKVKLPAQLPLPEPPKREATSIDMIAARIQGYSLKDFEAIQQKRRLQFHQVHKLLQDQGRRATVSRWRLAKELVLFHMSSEVRDVMEKLNVSSRAAGYVMRYMRSFRRRRESKVMHEISRTLAQETEQHSLVTEISGTKVAYARQADPTMNTPAMLRLRLMNRCDPQIQLAIREVWMMIPRCPKPCNDTIDKQIYFWLVGCLREDFVNADQQAATIRQVNEEWLVESGNSFLMDYEGFYSCIFTLLDVWCASVDISDYISLLKRIRTRIGKSRPLVYSTRLSYRHWLEWSQMQPRGVLGSTGLRPKEFPIPLTANESLIETSPRERPVKVRKRSKSVRGSLLRRGRSHSVKPSFSSSDSGSDACSFASVSTDLSSLASPFSERRKKASPTFRDKKKGSILFVGVDDGQDRRASRWDVGGKRSQSFKWSRRTSLYSDFRRDTKTCVLSNAEMCRRVSLSIPEVTGPRLTEENLRASALSNTSTGPSSQTSGGSGGGACRNPSFSAVHMVNITRLDNSKEARCAAQLREDRAQSLVIPVLGRRPVTDKRMLERIEHEALDVLVSSSTVSTPPLVGSEALKSPEQRTNMMNIIRREQVKDTLPSTLKGRDMSLIRVLVIRNEGLTTKDICSLCSLDFGALRVLNVDNNKGIGNDAVIPLVRMIRRTPSLVVVRMHDSSCEDRLGRVATCCVENISKAAMLPWHVREVEDVFKVCDAKVPVGTAVQLLTSKASKADKRFKSFVEAWNSVAVSAVCRDIARRSQPADNTTMLEVYKLRSAAFTTSFHLTIQEHAAGNLLADLSSYYSAACITTLTDVFTKILGLQPALRHSASTHGYLQDDRLSFFEAAALSLLSASEEA